MFLVMVENDAIMTSKYSNLRTTLSCCFLFKNWEGYVDLRVMFFLILLNVVSLDLRETWRHNNDPLFSLLSVTSLSGQLYHSQMVSTTLSTILSVKKIHQLKVNHLMVKVFYRRIFLDEDFFCRRIFFTKWF